MFRPNLLKQRLGRGEKLFGSWIATGNATNVEILGHSGFDYLLIDLEHGQGEISDLIAMLRAAETTGTPCVVRVPWNDPVTLKRVLDAGVDSVMIPMIENEDEAKAAVRACRYPPLGSRGYAAPLVRASTFGAVSDYIHRAADNLLIILQIESAGAVAQARTISAVDGVDIVFIGVNDLAGSIGRLEQLDHPDVRALVKQAETAIQASGRWLGTVPSAGASWQELFDAGYQFVPVASDTGLLRDAAFASVREQRRYRDGGQTAQPARKGGY
ncbi:HpcH/HpaI aldolase family protein [Taklimakanibacter lacteus]|uniref:HpcH/HpaI aldolase family protein n=1 Tax=Taklimakanibacter lacteus TaxID=2268456 RepID=UPI000E672788